MKKFLLITLGVIIGLGAAGAWWYFHNFRAAKFTPVELSQEEKKALDEKIKAHVPDGAQPAQPPVPAPEKTIVLTEREINGWLQQQGAGETVKVTISGGTIAAAALIPLDKDIPFVGGHTVRFKIALGRKMDDRNRFGFYVSDVTVGGISPPNAWLGGIKGRNLLEDFPMDDATKAFAEGVKSFDIGSGEIRVILND